MLTTSYNPALVAASIVLAVGASFTALSLTNRVTATSGRAQKVWLTTAAITLGGGIWSMHFVAMLALQFAHITVTYDRGTTLLSLAIAIGFTAAGFAIADLHDRFTARTALAGGLMGSGVLTMHYVGMAAMRMPAGMTYDPDWVGISIVIALTAATVSLWLAGRAHRAMPRLAAAGAMGVAIAGMHYAGMHAATFHATIGAAAAPAAGFNAAALAVVISIVTAAIFLVALGAAWLAGVFDAIAMREQRAALRLRIADALRQGSADEVLGEVARLLGEHFAVSRTGYGDLDAADGVFDYRICWTDGAVPPLLGRFPAAAFGVKIVAALTAGETVAIADLLTADQSDEPRTRETARSSDTRAILVVPFVRNGRLRTIVYLNHSAPRAWSAEDIAFAEELAERTRLFIERDAAEQQLRELNATLEARIAARTHELEQTQQALLQSQKMEAIGQLVAGLAHDFNNVLGAIVGAFDLIGRRSEEPARVRRFAEAGLQAAERGSKLTAQLLAFSRQQRIELRPVYVCELIEQTRDMIARTLGPMIRVDLTLHPTPVAVLADPIQLEMMLLNLAINARDAMPDGGTLEIATRTRQIARDAELVDGDYVEICVRDTGTGMDEETRRRAMEPFFTTKPVGKGTGLGLAQIYGSVRQGGGTVRIDSELGVGTTVCVLLPVTSERPATSADADTAGAAPALRSAVVLLVDDDHDLRGVLAHALADQGYKVVEAASGPAALAELERALPDVAVLDFAMPGLSGADLARRIREKWPDLPLIFASGYADTAALEAVCGGDARMLRKPFRVDDLLDRIAALICAD
jgi:NO-binding membrane sensor protein with MHYT domain/signal transduction histidine kinase